MLKNLFTKHDHRSVSGLTKEAAMIAASTFWRSRQFGINFTSGYSLQGSQFYSNMGLRQSVNVFVVEEGADVAVDLTFSAELSDEGAVAGVVGVVLLPVVAVAVGAISVMQYEDEAQRVMNDFWSYIFAFPKNTTSSGGPGATSPQAQAQAVPAPLGARNCPGCNAPQDPEARFCKYCGTKL